MPAAPVHMHHHNRAVAGVHTHHLDDLPRGDAATGIAGDDIPLDDMQAEGGHHRARQRIGGPIGEAKQCGPATDELLGLILRQGQLVAHLSRGEMHKVGMAPGVVPKLK